MDWEEHKKILLKDPEFREALKESEPEYRIARELILARINRKMSQKMLAKKIGTKQSVISRLETGQSTPSVSFLIRMARALNTSLNISFG